MGNLDILHMLGSSPVFCVAVTPKSALSGRVGPGSASDQNHT